MNTPKYEKLFPVLLFSIGAFGLNNLFQIPDWYDEVQAKAWTFTFQQVDIAEIILYLTSSFAFWLVWKNRSLHEIFWPAFAYVGVMLFSSSWSLLFFGLQSPLAAFIDMIVVALSIGVAGVQFYRYHRAAGWLMAPCFAGAVVFAFNNYHIYQVYTQIMSA